MLRTQEGSTGRLIQLCAGYFTFYVITGLTVKYFLGSPEDGLPGFENMEFLVYSTAGGNAVALAVVFALKWYRLKSNRLARWGRVKFPSEFLYIIPSGVCTAVVIPTTTLMYTLPISVMVAMVIMRGSVILIGRVVDAIQIRQGILDKKVYFEENLGVVFAILAVGVHLVYPSDGGGQGGGQFEFLSHPPAVAILTSYITAYALRIYLMNYFKNTRAKGVRLDNKGFYAIEQIAAFSTLAIVTAVIFAGVSSLGWEGPRIEVVHSAIAEPRPLWQWAILAGMAFGVASFFSVFLFMFKGRTATFAGLVNRLTSLIAGTTSTLLFALLFTGDMPEVKDWLSLGFIVIAIAFLSRAEKRRASELRQSESSEKPAG